MPLNGLSMNLGVASIRRREYMRRRRAADDSCWGVRRHWLHRGRVAVFASLLPIRTYIVGVLLMIGIALLQ